MWECPWLSRRCPIECLDSHLKLSAACPLVHVELYTGHARLAPLPTPLHPTAGRLTTICFREVEIGCYWEMSSAGNTLSPLQISDEIIVSLPWLCSVCKCNLGSCLGQSAKMRHQGSTSWNCTSFCPQWVPPVACWTGCGTPCGGLHIKERSVSLHLLSVVTQPLAGTGKGDCLGGKWTCDLIMSTFIRRSWKLEPLPRMVALPWVSCMFSPKNNCSLK